MAQVVGDMYVTQLVRYACGTGGWVYVVTQGVGYML